MQDRQYDWMDRYGDVLGVLGLVVVVATFHRWSTIEIVAYYQIHLPHYDSMGGYMQAYRILNAAHAGQWDVAWTLVTTFSLSQTQALFAFLLAPVLENTPQSLQLYNTLCVAAFCGAAYLAARVFLRVSVGRALLMSLVIFLPDTLYTWQGGLLDWQRDPSFFCLLAASFFLFFAFVAIPKWHIGLLLGLLMGITLISRDSAPPTMLLVFGALFPAWMVHAAINRGLRVTLLRSLWIVPTLLPFGVWFAVMQLLPTFGRLGNPFISFAVGGDHWVSLVSTWWVPFWLIVGEVSSLTLANISLILVLALVGAATAYASLSSPRSVALIAAGAWVALGTVVLLTQIYGLRPLSFPGIKHPYYPTMLFFLSLVFAGVAMLPHPRWPSFAPLRWVVQIMFAAFIGVLMMYAAIGRVDVKTRPPEPELMAAAQDLAGLLASPDGLETAALWHDGVSVDVVTYYAYQSGRTPPRRMVFAATDGSLVDTEIGLPQGVDPAAMRENLRTAIMDCARYILVTTDTDLYADASRGMFIYEYGKPLVDELLTRFPVVYRFNVGAHPVVVLENTGARVCR